jgi:hypothetical protein
MLWLILGVAIFAMTQFVIMIRPYRIPEAVVALAQRTGVGLIALRLNKFGEWRPGIGPGSVRHTVRFALDHAPCDVLLIRA